MEVAHDRRQEVRLRRSARSGDSDWKRIAEVPIYWMASWAAEGKRLKMLGFQRASLGRRPEFAELLERSPDLSTENYLDRSGVVLGGWPAPSAEDEIRPIGHQRRARSRDNQLGPRSPSRNAAR
jgi:hypothetical protein